MLVIKGEKMETIKVSVIVPVYNVEEYIEECIESIVNQTLKEIEIIIVNDGTKDNSMKKIEKYLSDSRIVIINKENGGISSARNAGLKIARGEYVTFIDSDDFIKITMLEKLYDQTSDFEIIFSDFIFYNNNSKKIEDSVRTHLKLKKINEMKGSYIYPEGDVVVWGKLYRTDFLKKNNLFFKEGIIHEDELFTIQSYFLAKKIQQVEEQSYCYRINRQGSIMNSSQKEKHMLAYEVIANELGKFRNNFKENSFEELRLYIYEKYYEGFAASFINKEISKEEIKGFEKRVKRIWEEESFSEFEKKIFKEDIKKVIKYKQYFYINIFDSFYWKNKLLTKKIFRRIIEGKVKSTFKKLFKYKMEI